MTGFEAKDGQVRLDEVNEEYQAFVDKFKPKKTTDDCYTPENIYDAVAEWTAKEYGVDPSRFVRPFWPGADYRRQEYATDSIVVDNPPFSILSEIVGFYCAKEIPFLLFGPALSIFAGYRPGRRLCYICTGSDVTFENGAVVKISFITSLEQDGTLVRSAPELFDKIDEKNRENLRKLKKELPKYIYPDSIITAAKVQWYTQHHTPFRLKAADAMFIRGIDAQQATGKSIFGGGFLLSEKAAAEKAAAEKAAAEKAAAEKAAATVWELSDREKEMQKSIGARFHGGGWDEDHNLHDQTAGT